ncbi:MAG: hypothetical protein U1F76_28115 [Candidatus Competibacteraceae bacterium]
MFVKRDDQIHGLTYLLTLGVRVLTVMEFILRRSLQQDQATLSGLHRENRHKQTNKPTAERVLKAFGKISPTILKDAAGHEIRRWLTPLSAVQQDILLIRPPMKRRQPPHDLSRGQGHGFPLITIPDPGEKLTLQLIPQLQQPTP